MKPLTLPQLSSHVTDTAGAGELGREKRGRREEDERVSLPFFPPSHHTPRALGRVF